MGGGDTEELELSIGAPVLSRFLWVGVGAREEGEELFLLFSKCGSFDRFVGLVVGGVGFTVFLVMDIMGEIEPLGSLWRLGDWIATFGVLKGGWEWSITVFVVKKGDAMSVLWN